MDEYIIRVNSPLGYEVLCTKKRFEEHIASGHEVMENNIESIKEAITNPLKIYKSKENEKCDVYFGRSTKATYSNGFFTKVIVEVTNKNIAIGDVLTAFPTKKIAGNIDIEAGPIYEANAKN